MPTTEAPCGVAVCLDVTPGSLWDEVREERSLQDLEHGGPDNDDLLAESEWVGLVTQFAGRAFSCARMGRGDLYRSRMLQVAAIAVAALESFDRVHGPPAAPAGVLRAGPDTIPASVPEGDAVPVAPPACLSGG